MSGADAENLLGDTLQAIRVLARTIHPVDLNRHADAPDLAQRFL